MKIYSKSEDHVMYLRETYWFLKGYQEASEKFPLPEIAMEYLWHTVCDVQRECHERELMEELEQKRKEAGIS